MEYCPIVGNTLHRDTAYRTKKEKDLSTHPRSGRPRLPTAAEDLAIVDYSHNHQMDTVPQIIRTLQCPVGEFSVRKRLHAAGVHNRMPASKEQLTASNIQQRIQFCNEHR